MTVKALARLREVSDVDTGDAIEIIVKAFADNDLLVKHSPGRSEGTDLIFTFKSPVDKKVEKFGIYLEGKRIIFDGMDSDLFSGDLLFDKALKGSPDMKAIQRKSGSRAFQKWADQTYKGCIELSELLLAYNKFVKSFSDAIIQIQALVDKNKLEKWLGKQLLKQR